MSPKSETKYRIWSITVKAFLPGVFDTLTMAETAKSQTIKLLMAGGYTVEPSEFEVVLVKHGMSHEDW